MREHELSLNPLDHIRGREEAPITLLEYGDYECPDCGDAYRKIRQLGTALGGNVKFVFRNFPVTSIHPRALLGAQAAEAAGLQGNFWKMHDLIFENQDILNVETVMQFASILMLDLEKFQSDLYCDELKAIIHDDFLGGVRCGVNGTPSFYVNGEKYNGTLDARRFAEILSPVPRDQHYY